MKENIKYEKKSKNLHTLKVTHKDFSELHQGLLYVTSTSKKVHKEMRALCLLSNVFNFDIEVSNCKVLSITYEIDQRNEFEDLKAQDKKFWKMTPFYRVLKV